MNVLAINTSDHVLGIAILNNGQIVGEFVTNLVKNHSVRLLPAIDHLMKEINMSPEQLDKIVVANGPGSYTGVRIGVSTAKSLAWALGIPIVGVSSLEVLAYQGLFFKGTIFTFFDARRDTVFTGSYKWVNNQLISVAEEMNILMEKRLEQISSENEGKEVLILSPDLSIYKEMIVHYLGSKAIIPEDPYHIAKPSHLAILGSGKDPDNTHTLTPNYLRLAEAEANWIKAQKESI